MPGVGAGNFKVALIAEAVSANEGVPAAFAARYDGAALQAANELRWELVVEQCMKRLKKNQSDITEEIESAKWKILIAAVLKCKTSATSVWIADKLNMGVAHAVSRYTSIFKQEKRDHEAPLKKLISRITK